jgi:transcriptional regulator with XRE-family HTH domain
MDPHELGVFLRHRRERLRPADVGLVPGPRRRVPGLRRDEVAVLADMSTDYYERIEQGRGPRPSPPMLGAICRALRLSLDERDHVHLLAGHAPPTGTPPSATPTRA